jgi:hypothetical protein
VSRTTHHNVPSLHPRGRAPGRSHSDAMARPSPRLALLILSALTFLSLASAKSGWGEACS